MAVERREDLDHPVAHGGNQVGAVGEGFDRSGGNAGANGNREGGVFPPGRGEPELFVEGGGIDGVREHLVVHRWLG